MGKGPYFVHQIRHNELFLLKNHRLPPPKAFARHGHHTLLDNEAILHDIQVYLASQALGTVNPRILCQHVNKVILPTLGIKGTIAELTARRWLRLVLPKFGFKPTQTRFKPNLNLLKRFGLGKSQSV